MILLSPASTIDSQFRVQAALAGTRTEKHKQTKKIHKYVINSTEYLSLLLHLLLFITRKYTIISANLKLVNAKIHSFYSIDIHKRRYATICIRKGIP